MAPKHTRPNSPSSSGSPKKPRRSVITWTTEADAVVRKLRTSQPPASWETIAAAVTDLGQDCNAKGAKNRWFHVLKFEEQICDDPLNDAEKRLLLKALQDYESSSDKWWFVSARYEMLRKGKEDSRVLGKAAAKKWIEALKKEGGMDAGLEGKKEKKEKKEEGKKGTQKGNKKGNKKVVTQEEEEEEEAGEKEEAGAVAAEEEE